MDHKTVCAIAGISIIKGILQTLSCMEGATITKGMAAELEFRAECLEAYIGDLIEKDVKDHEDAERAFDNIIP